MQQSTARFGEKMKIRFVEGKADELRNKIFTKHGDLHDPTENINLIYYPVLNVGGNVEEEALRRACEKGCYEMVFGQ